MRLLFLVILFCILKRLQSSSLYPCSGSGSVRERGTERGREGARNQQQASRRCQQVLLSFSCSKASERTAAIQHAIEALDEACWLRYVSR
jgi:hypothetical protein